MEDIRYNPETGIFTWNVSRGKARKGSPAGHYNKDNGYIEIQVRGVKYYAHRLAFLLMGEEIPEIVDHINRDRTDNRWCNLRKADYTLNSHNSSIRRNNTSGVRFVSWDSANQKWRVAIKMKDGWFRMRTSSLEEAKEVAIAKSAERDNERET